MALADGHVYWKDSSSNEIRRLPVSGGEATVVASGPEFLGALAADDDTLVWSDALSGVLMKSGLQGQQPLLLATALTDPSHVAIDADFVYFSARADGIESLMRVSKDGGSLTTLAAIEAGRHFVLAGEFAYFGTGGTVQRVPRTGGAVEEVLADAPYGVLAAGADHLCATGAGTVQCIPLSGGALFTLASGIPGVRALAIDGRYVYWHQGSSDLVRKAIDASGAIQVLSSTFTRIDELAFDANAIYGTTGEGIVKFRKPP